MGQSSVFSGPCSNLKSRLLARCVFLRPMRPKVMLQEVKCLRQLDLFLDANHQARLRPSCVQRGGLRPRLHRCFVNDFTAEDAEDRRGIEHPCDTTPSVIPRCPPRFNVLVGRGR